MEANPIPHWSKTNKRKSQFLRSPAQVGCMRQLLGPGALRRPRGIGWRGRWEGGSRWGIHVTPWLIHVNVWQNPLKCCEVISLQLIKINLKKKRKKPCNYDYVADLGNLYFSLLLVWLVFASYSLKFCY